MSNLIIGIDPGLMTGFGIVDKDTLEVVDSQEIGSWWDVGKRVHNIFIDNDSLNYEVVIEKFTITTQTGKKSQQPFSLKLIGAIEYLCYRYDVMCTEQTPAEAKNFSTNDKLRNLELWHVGGAGHANDAMRHILVYMVKNGFRDPRMLSI